MNWNPYKKSDFHSSDPSRSMHGLRAFSAIEPLESRIAPAVFIVTTLNDTTDPAHDTGSLRDALAKSDALGGHNTIKFHLPAATANNENTITLSNGVLESIGDVTIMGPGAGKLIINGNNSSGVFQFGTIRGAADHPVSITGLSIVNGNSSTSLGGGIYSYDSLSLKNVVVSGNTANGGAGIAVFGAGGGGTTVSISNSLITKNTATFNYGGMFLEDMKSVTISKTVVTGNTAGGEGGGFYAGLGSTGTGMKITGSVISGNTATSGGGLDLSDSSTVATATIAITGTKIAGNRATTSKGFGGGGLMLVGGNAVITGSTIENNSASYDGGGIDARGFNSLTISKSLVTGNETTATNATGQGGGGVFLYGYGTNPLSKVVIAGSAIGDNVSALDGGGVLASGGLAMSVTKSKISGNTATGFGGGLTARGSGANKVNLTITNSLFTDNLGGHGGGVAFTGPGSGGTADGTFTMTTSILTGNVATASGGGAIVDSNGAEMIKNSTVTNNQAVIYGGGLDLGITSTLSLQGGLVSSNVASTGGGMFLQYAMGNVVGTIISGNAASSRGGGVDQDSTVSLALAKIFANTAPTAADVLI